MSTAVLYGLSKEFRKLERRLRKKNLSEQDRKMTEQKLVEVIRQLRAEIRSWEERQRINARSN